MADAVLYDLIMRMELEAIEETFPLGAVKVPGPGKAQDRWRPADSKDADRTLTQLLRDKKARSHVTRIPHKDSSKGYTSDPHMGMHQEPEAVDEGTQRRLSEEARERFEQAVPLSVQIAEIENKLRPQQLASLRKRVESLKRATHEEAA